MQFFHALSGVFNAIEDFEDGIDHSNNMLAWDVNWPIYVFLISEAAFCDQQELSKHKICYQE